MDMVNDGKDIRLDTPQAVREAREASAKLVEENGGTDTPDGKDER